MTARQLEHHECVGGTYSMRCWFVSHPRLVDAGVSWLLINDCVSEFSRSAAFGAEDRCVHVVCVCELWLWLCLACVRRHMIMRSGRSMSDKKNAGSPRAQ